MSVPYSKRAWALAKILRASGYKPTEEDQKAVNALDHNQTWGEVCRLRYQASPPFELFDETRQFTIEVKSYFVARAILKRKE